MFDEAVCGNRLEDTVKAMRYAINLVGVDFVALGTDFDGAVKAPIDASVTGLRIYQRRNYENHGRQRPPRFAGGLTNRIITGSKGEDRNDVTHRY